MTEQLFHMEVISAFASTRQLKHLLKQKVTFLKSKQQYYYSILHCWLTGQCIVQGLFQGGGGRGGLLPPPMKVFAPPQELAELTY